MAIATIVTRGYGSGASIALVVTRGYSIAGADIEAKRTINIIGEGRTVTIIGESRTVRS